MRFAQVFLHPGRDFLAIAGVHDQPVLERAAVVGITVFQAVDEHVVENAALGIADERVANITRG